jgi:hypothetical protein
MLMLAGALPGMLASESHPKGHRAIKIKASIASFAQSWGTLPFSHPVQALTAYADRIGARPLDTT